MIMTTGYVVATQKYWRRKKILTGENEQYFLKLGRVNRLGVCCLYKHMGRKYFPGNLRYGTAKGWKELWTGLSWVHLYQSEKIPVFPCFSGGWGCILFLEILGMAIG